MDTGDISRGFEGLVRLATVGVVSLMVLATAAVVGVPLLIYWLWTHVTVTVH